MEGSTGEIQINHLLPNSSEGTRAETTPLQKMNQAREFFQAMAIPFDENNLVSNNPTPEQLEKMKAYRDQSFLDGLEMPTESDFYKKVLLAVSLWHQKDGDKVTYLLGKGVGIEVALQGNAVGRIKRPQKFPYRTHSDFEIYGINVSNQNPESGNNTKVYSDQFKQVFGAQEIFPSTQTKALRNLPPEFLHQTAQPVQLGDVEVLVPELELLFLDKWELPGAYSRPEGSDAQLLAQQYELDKDKIHQYLEDFIISPQKEKLAELTKEQVQNQLGGIRRNLNAIKVSFAEENVVPTHEQVIDRLNENIQQYISPANESEEKQFGVVVSGISVDNWLNVMPNQIDETGNIVDPELITRITQKVQQQELLQRTILDAKHQKIDELFASIEPQFPTTATYSLQ